MADSPDATEWLRRLSAGEIDAPTLVRTHLDQIEASQPRLNAATQILREQALEQARTPRPGPLSGLPITLKETYALAGEQVTIGSARMPPIACAKDAPVVQKLRAAGAIVVARSNVPEFVMNAETNNLRFGRSNNPIDPLRTCGGSSGGEGALVGSGASPLGFGTDILGSIRIPAAFCGVVGFRPHSGAIDKRGVWPVSGPYFESWNGLGPLARSVRDARLAYNVMAEQPLPAPATVAGLRVLQPRGFGLRYADACIERAYAAAGQALAAAGMRPEQPRFDDVPRLFGDIPRLVTGEMLPLWTQWLSRPGARFSPLAEGLRQLLRRPTVDPAFFQWFALAPVMRPRRRGRLAQIVARYEAARARYHALLGADGILLLPTLGLLAPRHGRMNRATLRPGLNGLVTGETFVNYCNLSAISVPAHRHADPATGLKPGIMLACAPGAEARLLDAAAALEAAI